MTILTRTLLALIASGTVATADPVGFKDADTALHPHLKAYTTKTVEGGKETFKEVYEYGADGRLQQRKNWKDGQLIETVQWTWDANGRLAKRVDKNDINETTTRNYVYTLDKSSRIETVVINGQSKDAYRWDAKGGREVTTTHPDGKGGDVFDMSITFDAAGKVLKRCTSTGMITTDIKPTTSCTIFELDKQGQVIRSSVKPKSKYSSAPESFKNTYDKQGRLTKITPTTKGDTVTTLTWNEKGDLATWTEGSGADAMVTTYSYELR